MEKTATLNLRVNPDDKAAAERVLSQLGIPMSTAVTMFLKQIALTGGIPFAAVLPQAPRSIDAFAMTDQELVDKLKSSLAEIDSGRGMALDDAIRMLEA